MGLVLLELTLRMKETFRIEIPDAIAYELTTPSKVTDYILTQVGESPLAADCLSQKAFHLLRRNFVEHLSLRLEQFKLNTHLKKIVSVEKRNELWKDLGQSVGMKKWPTMSPPKLLSFIPSTVESVRDLVDYLLLNEPLAIKGEETGWSRAEVWDVLKRIIIDETLVKDFSENSRFVEHMGLS